MTDKERERQKAKTFFGINYNTANPDVNLVKLIFFWALPNTKNANKQPVKKDRKRERTNVLKLPS